MASKILFSHQKVYFWISAFDHRAIVVPKMHIVHCADVDPRESCQLLSIGISQEPINFRLFWCLTAFLLILSKFQRGGICVINIQIEMSLVLVPLQLLALKESFSTEVASLNNPAPVDQVQVVLELARALEILRTWNDDNYNLYIY